MLTRVCAELFEHPAFPGFHVFECERHRALLSPAACAVNYVAGRAFCCSACPTGRLHAIEAGRVTRNEPLRRAELEATKCSRCRRGAVRLVHRRICVSCFNREREFLKGRNAKGTQPQKVRLAVGEALIADDDAPVAGGVEVVPVGAGAWLVSFLVADEAELRRSLPAIAPTADLLDLAVVRMRELRLQASKFRKRGAAAFGSALNDR